MSGWPTLVVTSAEEAHEASGILALHKYGGLCCIGHLVGHLCNLSSCCMASRFFVNWSLRKPMAGGERSLLALITPKENVSQAGAHLQDHASGL